MPTDIFRLPAPSLARNFVVGAIVYSVAIFGVLKLGWVATHLLWPLTQWQGAVAQAILGAPALPIDVTLDCSGADALALCAGAILAYPASWKLRFVGSAAGFALIVILNTIRIGSLGRAAASPMLFEALHVYVWPALLILAIAGFVFGWMQMANERSAAAAAADAPVAASHGARTFAVWTVVLVTLFVVASSAYLQSGVLLAIASFIARSAADVLQWIRFPATASANILWTSKGGFEVTQECISTPLIPLYVAGVMTYADRWRWRALGIAAAVPLFVALGIVRLLVVALPGAVIGSPFFLIHAFYQLALAAFVVCVAVAWRRGGSAWRIAVLACVAGVACAYVVSPAYDWLLSRLSLAVPFADPQGAMASMPSFQTGLFIALSIATMTVIAWRRFALGLATLAAVQIAAFGLLSGASRYSAVTPHIRDVRAWSIAAPLAIIVIGAILHDRPRR